MMIGGKGNNVLFVSKAFAKHPHPKFLQPNRDRELEMATEITFKHPQPFTWAQVMDLDLGIISQGTHTTLRER
jgi:hypothetical protein